MSEPVAPANAAGARRTEWNGVPMCVAAVPNLLTDEDVLGEGWVELLVTELPEPDAVPSANTKIWTIEDDWLAVEHGDLICSGLARDPDRTRSEALKMLAAVATCERYRKDVAQ